MLYSLDLKLTLYSSSFYFKIFLYFVAAMKEGFDTKINDYNNYVVLAIDNFKKLHYSDSAINCRKAAEACCKIIIFHALPQKLAEQKVKDKTLKDLILVLIKDGLAQRKVINTIESLQITGNKAAHDNVITKQESAYALNALELLTNYLFVEHLKIKVPTVLHFDLDKPVTHKKSETKVIEKIIIKEQNDKTKVEEWQHKIENLEKQNEVLKNEINQNLKEFKQFAEKAIEPQPPPQSQPQPQFQSQPQPQSQPENSPKKNSQSKVLVWSITALLIIAIGGFFYWRLKGERKLEEKITKLGDTIYVAINKLQILQDNPNMDFKIESVLKSHITQKFSAFALPVKIIETNFDTKYLIADSSILSYAKAKNYDVVYWGNLFESALADSNLLEIKGSLTSDRYFFRNKKIKFKSLADSVFIMEINDQANTPSYFYCRSKEEQKSFPRLIKIMQSLNSYSQENYICMQGQLARFYLKSRNYKAGLKVYDTICKLDPNHIFFIQGKALCYLGMNKFDSAGVYYKKGLAIRPKNVTMLISYADFFVVQRMNDSGLVYYKKALSLNDKIPYAQQMVKAIQNNPKGRLFTTDDFDSAFAQAEKYFFKAQVKQAIPFYLRCLELDPFHLQSKVNLAKCYHDLGDLKTAKLYCRQAMMQDSTDEVIVIYNAFLIQENPETKSLAMPAYERALALYPKSSILLKLYTDYLIAQKKYLRCIEVCKAPIDNKYNLALMHNLAHSYALLKDYYNAKNQYELINLMNPCDTNRILLAECCLPLCKSTADPQYKQGLKAIVEVLRSNPKNEMAKKIFDLYRFFEMKQAAVLNNSANDERNKKQILKILEREMKNRQLPADPNLKKLSNAQLLIKLDAIGSNNAIKAPGKSLFVSPTASIVQGAIGINVFKKCRNGSVITLQQFSNGGAGQGTQYNKGKGPEPDEKMFSPDEILNMVLQNKSLKTNEILNFLDTQKKYYQLFNSRNIQLQNQLNNLLKRIDIEIEKLKPKPIKT